MNALHRLALISAWLLPLSALGSVDEAAIGSGAERHLPGDEQYVQWTRDAERLATLHGDEIATREVVVAAPETVKLSNVV
ncbi:MAG TPA: hypothetical protein VIZ30_11375, partial [Pseudomonadales bacterium]